VAIVSHKGNLGITKTVRVSISVSQLALISNFNTDRMSQTKLFFTKWLEAILKPIRMPYWWQDFLFLIPRLLYGFLLTSDFGAAKFGLPWSPKDNNLGLFEVAFWFPHDVADYGGIFAMFPEFFAWMGAFSEGVGGIFLMLGLLTRPFAALTFATMFVAVFYQQFNQGTWNMLPAMGIMWVALFYTVLGSGKFGIDHLISKKLYK
jgi:putative oxidoreductase